MKPGKKTLLFLAGAVIVSVMVAACPNKNKEEADPLKAKAREKYDEGRRLFLTCDPNNYPKAAQLFDDALAYWDEYPEALAGWAETQSMLYGHVIPQDIFEEAYTRAQRAIRIAPDLDMGYRAMADLWRHHKDPKTNQYDIDYAGEVIERALKIAPASAENLYVKGSILMDANPEQALDVLRQAQASNPNLAKIYYNLAGVHQILADRLMAQAGNDPEKLKAAKEAAEAHDREALKDLKTYQNLVPGDLSGYLSKGLVYLRLNQVPEAEQMFQKTASVNPNPDVSQVRWRIMAYIYLAQISENSRHDLAGAKTYSERALDSAPNNLELVDRVIRLCGLMKDNKCLAQYQEKRKQVEQKLKEMKAAASQPKPGPAAGLETPPAPAPAGSTAGATKGNTTAPAPGKTVEGSGAKPTPPPAPPAAPGSAPPPVP